MMRATLNLVAAASVAAVGISVAVALVIAVLLEMFAGVSL